MPTACRSCAFPTLPQGALERFQSLPEQLRAMEHGHVIVVRIRPRITPAAGVDTPADLERVRLIYRNRL